MCRFVVGVRVCKETCSARAEALAYIGFILAACEDSFGSGKRDVYDNDCTS